MPFLQTKIDPVWAWAPFEPGAKQPWTKALAAHLYRRAGFAATTAELDAAVRQGLAATVSSFFALTASPARQGEGLGQLTGAASRIAGKPAAPAKPAKPDNQPLADADPFAAQMSELGTAMMATGKAQNLPGWWLFRMLRTPQQLLEKTTLFWHGHFATSAAKVDNVALMMEHNELLRTHALGRFEPFVQAISRDVAMLLWLDAASNRKIRPNENYAREVMELFCLGVGNYTERDIKEVARTFTGWEVNNDEFKFNKYQHDEGSKSFLGKSGNFNGDDAVRIILEQPAASRFIARKLAKFFVAEEPALDDAVIEPLAAELRGNGFDIGAAVRRILSSNLFYSEHAVGRLVRSPVSLGIGLLRALEAKANMNLVAQRLQEMGQAVFYPPNVKGWDGGRTWINSSTLLARANFVREIVLNENTTFAGGSLAALAEKHAAGDPKTQVDWLLGLLVAVPVPDAVRQRLAEIAGGRGDRNATLANTVHAIGTLPEFQLC